MRRVRFSCLIALAGGLVPVPLRAADVVFSGTSGSYSATPTYTTSGSSISYSQGSALQFQATFADSTSTTAVAEVGVINSSFTYSPLTQGAIQSITASVDKNLTINPSRVQANLFWPMIEQDGNYYIATIPGLYFLGGSSGLLSFSQAGLLASDFVEYSFATGTFRTGNPNFAGDPMTFGLAELFSSKGEPASTGSAVYDNLSFDLVTAPLTPVLTVAPALVSFSAQANSSAPLQQSIVVQNSGSGSIAFNASVAGGSPWVSISPGSGTVAAGSSVTVTVTANAQALGAGNYQDVVQLSSNAGPVDVPVTLFATNTGPILWARPGGILFTMLQGAGLSATQNVIIANQGGSTINWTAAPAANPGIPNGNFLSLGSSSGSVSSGNVVSLPLSLNSSVLNLATGVYYELIEIAASGAQNSPQYVTAVLNVLPSTSTVLPQLTPGGMLFTGAVGQTIASQTLTVNWSATPALPQVAQAVATTSTDLSWIQITPAGGIASTGSPLVITVSANTAGLAPGVYTGTINFFNIGPPILESVNVTLVLTSGATPALHPESVVAGCTPSALVLTETGIPDNFTVPAGWPANLIALMTDDCANPIDGGSVTASFSDGDAPLSLADQGNGGQYIGTWQPSNSANALISLKGTFGNLTPAVTPLAGLVTRNQAPVLSPNGILNNLNPLAGGALAPGTVAAAYGTGLTTSANPITPGVSPLLTEVQNTELIVGGFIAPLYYLSNQQLNVEIPAEIGAQQQVAAVGVVNGALTLPVSVAMVPVTPGVAAYTPGGNVIAQHSDFSLVTSTSPAQPGEALTIYLVGMGATNPAVPSGQPAPGLNPGDILASATLQPVVKVNNQTAQILFAGLTPGAIGLYQINFVVPATAPAGGLSLTVSQGSVNANPTILLVDVP